MSLDELGDRLRADPHRPAFLDHRGRVQLTRGELVERADRLAAGLHQWGLGAGDTIALAVRPGPDAVALLLAALRLRVRVALVDPSAGAEVVRARLELATPALVVADRVARAAAGWAAPLARRAGIDLPPLDQIAPVVGLSDLAVHDTIDLPDRRGEDGDALVIFTSGTTRAPRAVVHTTGSLDAGLRAVTSMVEVDANRSVLGGTFFVIAPSLLAGAPVSLPVRGARRFAAQHRRLAPQVTYLEPPALRDLLATGTSLTGRFFSGSAPVSARLLRRTRDAGASQAWGVYAMTEAFPVAAVEADEKAAFDGDGDLVGSLVGEIRPRIDEDGDLHLSGPGVCDRYLGQPPLVEVASGDVARMDGDRLVLAGRTKEMILRRAVNIYPGLYEPALHVTGVELAVLVCVPADDLDEQVVLVVQPEPGWSEPAVRRALRKPVAGMGFARPDQIVVDRVPTVGRSRKPDRQAAAALAQQAVA